MAKFYGAIGFATTDETKPGVYREKLTERFYYGDVYKNTKNYQQSGNVNDNITISMQISIISDNFGNQHCSEIRYVVLNGVRWKVSSFEIQHPRLVLTVGGVYNG